MCDWYRTAESETAGGHPTQWYTDDGLKFLVSFIRCSGPGDHEIPRRVVALESHPHVAYMTAKKVLELADPSCRIVARVAAGVADARV